MGEALRNAQQPPTNASNAYGPPGPEEQCEPQEGDEIVVCADAPDDPDQYRIGSSLDRGDDSHLSREIRAPDFSAPPCVPSLLTLCPRFGDPPPPAYIIDFAALPETPAGSDAERVGQGLAPRDTAGPDEAGDAESGRELEPE